jgi:hypothetical protein
MIRTPASTILQIPIQSPDLLLERATADAQLWNDLLSSSGGALEIPKCVYHLAHYGFTEAGTLFNACDHTQLENPGMFQDSLI